jgi:hypothetical protein
MKFKIKLETYLYVLIAIALLISILGLGLNVFNVVEYASFGAFRVISYLLISVICLFLAVIAVSLLINCSYVIKGEYLISRFGIFTSKIKISDIVELVHAQAQNKLILYYGEDKYVMVLISPDKFDDFISKIIKLNVNVCYSVDLKK